ncbi:hypothetical protein [Mangrovimonas sp. YM274]|uniref:hypothetical protein n=1 Tax=Mangrovimonas sp. YM274 TaxID=3070660 RepID=UPI0027DE073D|nr:hypothetical protein [Mangrovimonas sp. YM274]WMI69943.1 hypothetical protein RBH95_06240 [Mangrovimonas sp. YM274]
MFTILLFASTFLAYSQDNKVYFNDALSQHLKPYVKKSNLAFENKDYELAEILFDSLLANHLLNTFIPNLKLPKVSGGNLETDDIKNPFLLITKTTWDFPVEKEIEAINTIAEAYRDQVEIIVLYWGTKKNVKKITGNYNRYVTITYIDETENLSNSIIKTYKHSFGAPACFFVSSTKQLMALDKKFSLFSFDMDQTKQAYAYTENHIKELIFLFEEFKKSLLTDRQ